MRDKELLKAQSECILECHARLQQKENDGCFKWKKMGEIELRGILLKNFDQDPPDYIDVINIATMLWYKYGRK
jgi:hypothetical protein